MTPSRYNRDVTLREPSKLPGWYRDLHDARVVSGVLAEASSVSHDSRRVTPDGVFVAIPGLKTDGNEYIPEAIAAGARYVVVQEDPRDRWEPCVRDGVTFVAVPDARVALAEAAAGFYVHPARALGMVGVTGTDGKTTTTHLVAHVLTATGRRAGHLSSVEFGDGQAAELNASHMTTLEAVDVQRLLARIRDMGARYAVVEASSIGLALHRVDQCEFDVGVFTNLTPDHLDVHGTMDAYRDAKALLFRMLGESLDKGVPKAAVLNSGDPAFGAMRAATSVPAITYGFRADAEVSVRDIMQDGLATRFAIRCGGREVPARTALLGDYNVANCLAAVGVALSQGIELNPAVATIESFPGVPGRMELIEAGQLFRVAVDIASTEQAMRNVLRMLRPVTGGRLLVVFGAAGERDVERRHGLARAVAETADYAVITNEDPRSEDPDAIIAEIAAALAAVGFDEGRRFQRVPDRRAAIAMAFDFARKGDTVLLAGKGTEQSMVFGSTHVQWDERRVARELLGERHRV